MIKDFVQIISFSYFFQKGLHIFTILITMCREKNKNWRMYLASDEKYFFHASVEQK